MHRRCVNGHHVFNTHLYGFPAVDDGPAQAAGSIEAALWGRAHFQFSAQKVSARVSCLRWPCSGLLFNKIEWSNHGI
jgi:hypothetical protein